MRKFSILLLLISIPLMAMEVSAPSRLRRRTIDFQRWQTQHRRIVPIPIEAIHNENYIEVRFIENVDNQVTFQVKDQDGNILWQDTTIPNKEEIYKIDLNGFTVGHYKLFYFEDDLTLVGEFDIEYSNS